jgi:hypothetical protein
MSDERNPLRDAMVSNIIMTHPDTPLTVEALAPFLPDTFDLGEDDLQVYRDAHPLEFDADAPAEPAEFKPIKISKPGDQPPTPAPVFSAETIQLALQCKIAADQALADARVLQMTEDRQERELRAKLAEAVAAFQSGFPKVTRDQLMREFIASEQQRRAGGVPQRQAQSRPGKSYFDRSRFYGARGDANDMARQSAPLTEAQARKIGGHGPGTKGNARGAFPKHMLGATNYDPRRGAVPGSLPSERPVAPMGKPVESMGKRVAGTVIRKGVE